MFYRVTTIYHSSQEEGEEGKVCRQRGSEGTVAKCFQSGRGGVEALNGPQKKRNELSTNQSYYRLCLLMSGVPLKDGQEGTFAEESRTECFNNNSYFMSRRRRRRRRTEREPPVLLHCRGVASFVKYICQRKGINNTFFSSL